MNYLNPTGKAKIILTTGFWRYPGDKSIKEFGEENTLPVVLPGDLGMEKIAEGISRAFLSSGLTHRKGRWSAITFRSRSRRPENWI